MSMGFPARSLKFASTLTDFSRPEGFAQKPVAYGGGMRDGNNDGGLSPKQILDLVDQFGAEATRHIMTNLGNDIVKRDQEASEAGDHQQDFEEKATVSQRALNDVKETEYLESFKPDQVNQIQEKHRDDFEKLRDKILAGHKPFSAPVRDEKNRLRLSFSLPKTVTIISRSTEVRGKSKLDAIELNIVLFSILIFALVTNFLPWPEIVEFVIDKVLDWLPVDRADAELPKSSTDSAHIAEVNDAQIRS